MQRKHRPHKTILLDASSAILLAKAGFHEALAIAYHIILSESVFDEITRTGLAGSVEYRQLLQKKQLKVLPLPTPQPQYVADVSLQKLDKGERDTIYLFHGGYGDFVVTDDGAAARFCLGNSIPFVNSLLILRLLNYSTQIKDDSYEAGFQSLLTLGRYSQKVQEYASSCPNSELLFFLP